MDKIKFNYYKKKDGHADLKKCLEEADDLVKKITPIILKEKDLTLSDKTKDKIRRIKALKKSAENYLINKQRYHNNNHAFRPLYVIWTMLNPCNFKCSYCDNHQGEKYFELRDPERLNTAQAKKLLDVIITGTPAIYWCGGEPTIRNDFPQLLNYAFNLGFFPNMINTNGSLLHKRLQQPEWNKFLNQMDIIIISVDALNINKLNNLWGVKNSQQVITNLLMMKKLQKQVNFKLAVNTVITVDTLDEARSVLDLVCDLGVWFAPVPVNHKHEPNKELLNNPKYIKLANLILKRKKQGHKIIGSQTLLKRLLFCEPYKCFTTLKPHIWSNGHLCWPCRASVNVKPVDINLLKYKTFDDAYSYANKIINSSFFHGNDKNQCGGECSWMQNYTTSRYMDGVINPLKSGILNEISEFALNNKNL